MAARRTYALAYYLTMFHGFGASAFLDTSRDRLMGILFGLLTTAIVFDVLGGHPKPAIGGHLFRCPPRMWRGSKNDSAFSERQQSPGAGSVISLSSSNLNYRLRGRL